MTRSELLSQLQDNKDLGIAFGQNDQPIQVMTYREFLNWYADAMPRVAGTRSFDHIDDEGDTITGYEYYETVCGKTVFRQKFVFQDAEDRALNYFYEVMEMRYMDDNGSGGIFTDNSQSIADIEQGKYDEYFETVE